VGPGAGCLVCVVWPCSLAFLWSLYTAGGIGPTCLAPPVHMITASLFVKYYGSHGPWKWYICSCVAEKPKRGHVDLQWEMSLNPHQLPCSFILLYKFRP